MPKRISILGSTGSIGRSALDVIRRHPERFDVVGLAAHSNAELLAAQIAEFQPRYAAMANPDASDHLRGIVNGVTVFSGEEGLERLASCETDLVLGAMVGAVGLKPILKAIEVGHVIALANKEPLVMAGKLIIEKAQANDVQLLPVDSEHSAIFQCLEGRRIEEVDTIFLTASGGPFYGRNRDSLQNVSADEAANHPRWDMGRKISVDSATLMNKGLEVIEAMWLFGVPVEQVQVVVHPQSIVHGLVEFTDGSLLAHLGLTDMRFPIEFALTWPKRVASPIDRLNLAELGTLTFAAPDFSEFPCLEYALESARRGGTAPTVLNAANEAAVEAFCRERIPFLSIAEVVQRVVDTCPWEPEVTLSSVLDADRTARETADRVIRTLGV